MTLPGRDTDGWERRFMAGGPRLREAEELYRGLGFDVRLDSPTADDLREECGDCQLALKAFRVLYTRRES